MANCYQDSSFWVKLQDEQQLPPAPAEEKNARPGFLHPAFNMSLTGIVHLLTEEVFWIFNAGNNTREYISDT